MPYRHLHMLIVLAFAGATTPVVAQQRDSLPAQDSARSTDAMPPADTTAAASPARLGGPRLTQQFQRVELPRLAPASGPDGSSLMARGGNTTITISTLTLVLVTIIVVLLLVK